MLRAVHRQATAPPAALGPVRSRALRAVTLPRHKLGWRAISARIGLDGNGREQPTRTGDGVTVGYERWFYNLGFLELGAVGEMCHCAMGAPWQKHQWRSGLRHGFLLGRPMSWRKIGCAMDAPWKLGPWRRFMSASWRR
jgi:hypothetical protein